MSSPSGARRARPSMAQVIGGARRELEQLTSRPVDSVTSVQRDGEGWVLELEVVELERIPASTSVLGSYRVDVDGDGHIAGYERTHRYYRNQASEGELP
ncbi:MAG TPA: gas vesicle protein GvpO [Acidimicrobiales bacterium]|nr:gas vesicle protein GvpO [Acidimicrobiales bacterium]